MISDETDLPVGLTVHERHDPRLFTSEMQVAPRSDKI